MKIPGVRSAILRRTKKSRQPRREEAFKSTEVREVYQVSKPKTIRQFANNSNNGTGAPRVETIVGGEYLVDAILDAGSHCSILSLGLAKELGVEIKEDKSISGSRMADGNMVRTISEVKDLLVAVQGVLVKISFAVFERPPYDVLLGSDCMKLLGIAADYSTSHFCIRTNNGLCPLEVSFDTHQLRRQRLQSEDEYLSEYNTEYTTEEESSSDESHTELIKESYLVIPCTNEVEEDNIKPTSHETKVQILQERVQDCVDLDENQKERLLGKAIIQATQLKYPDPNAQYKIYCDASDVGIGAVLAQWDEEEMIERPVCFLSRKLTHTEMNYPTVEKECLALVFALQRLRRYVPDKDLVIMTDSTAVKYLFTKSNPRSRLQRWIVSVQEFQFKVNHLHGKNNVAADVLSRYPPNNLETEEEISPDIYLFDTWILDKMGEDYEPHLIRRIKTLTDYTRGEQPTPGDKGINARFRLGKDQSLFRRVGDRYLKIPKFSERDKVLKDVHDGHGHFGQEATWQRLYESYWWPDAYRSVKDYVKTCENCQLHSYLPNKIEAKGTVPIKTLFERFANDYVGPFPTSNRKNQYIITAIEYYTGWPIAKAVRRADSDTTVKFFYEEIFCNFGPRTKLLSDNGTHFSSEEVEKFVKFVNTTH
ncbi:Transposon Ty3-I Gag-Pol polyprotein [Choanephora cucurbitarum]|uniref:Transposon Ty3-I Gag-Pol polyprotein n=1 Tax=Choanephora cucurbitarum TaxID=101091 RepID=A0A1C7MXK8_9FUNG|nr:Transposon Ty3-I Gag-Pol polyprotein [Choanephora cucurbitarum]